MWVEAIAGLDERTMRLAAIWELRRDGGTPSQHTGGAMTVPREKLDLSLRDVQRRRFARPLVPHLLTFPCIHPKCDGLFTFTGRSFQQGMGPLINIHTCDRCGQELELADDYYPRLIYRDGSATVNINTGRVEL